MTDTFDISFNNLLGWEGGYGNNAKDPGGPTNLGVIQTEYNAYRTRKGLPAQSVKRITLAEAEEIYRNEYWTPTRCDELNPGVANCLFDGDVNSGDQRGVTWLQRAINETSGCAAVDIDGSCGPLTVAAANALPPDKLIDSMLNFRFAFMKIARNPKTGALLFPTFGKGWTARINGVRVQSHKLAGVEMASAPITPEITQQSGVTSMATITPTPTLSSNTSPVVAAAVQGATLSLSSIWASIAGSFSSVAVSGVLGFLATMAPTTATMALAIIGGVAALVSAIAHVYAIATGVSATNNATIQLVENFINTVETGLGGKPIVFDNNPPAA